MAADRFALAAVPMLVVSLRATGAFLGCCDDDPPPAPAPATSGIAITEGEQPSMPPVIIHGPHISTGASITVPGELDLSGRIETSSGGTFVYIGGLRAQPRKVLAPGQKAPPPAGGTEAASPPSGGVGSVAPAPKPRQLYRVWRSPEIETAVLDAPAIQAIEGDGHPLRFAFSLPFPAPAEFLASDVQAIFVEAHDANGADLLPGGAQLVSTPAVVGEWPISSVFLWPATSLPVLSVSFDLVNADGSMVTPTQLGCGQHAVRFRIGLASRNPSAAWDFGWAAGLWRTETDVNHVGGGLWLGWHAGSFEALGTMNAPPRILALTDPSGTPLTGVTRGGTVLLTVLGGFAPADTEAFVGGYSMPVLGFTPGASAGESVYALLVPPQAASGPATLFFRNLGATMATAPTLVQQVLAGFDYVPVDVR